MPFQRSRDVLFELFEDRAVLLDPAGSELLTLNPVGTLVWQELEDADGASSLADRLLPRFRGVTRGQLEQDIESFLGELKELGLVVEMPPDD